jgi:tetratricopeptide (TPR) repeat protein
LQWSDMKNSKVIFLLIIISCLNLSLKAEQVAEVSGNYPLELMKHYISQQEYDLALQVLDDYPVEEESADSLIWLVAHVYKTRQDYNGAADKYARVITISVDSLLVTDSVENLISIVPYLTLRTAINLLVDAVKNVTANDNYLILIMKLAELYESSYLYSEANDIYTNLLESDLDIDVSRLYIKVATNKVFEKKYSEAVVYADKAGSVVDSVLSAEALFIQFLSYQALENEQAALPPLLKLYLNFPDYAGIFEINLSLAELLADADETLAAWFVLEKYYPKASELEQRLIIEQIRSLKDSMEIGSEMMQYFDNIEFNFTPMLGEE